MKFYSVKKSVDNITINDINVMDTLYYGILSIIQTLMANRIIIMLISHKYGKIIYETYIRRFIFNKLYDARHNIVIIITVVNKN